MARMGQYRLGYRRFAQESGTGLIPPQNETLITADLIHHSNLGREGCAKKPLERKLHKVVIRAQKSRIVALT